MMKGFSIAPDDLSNKSKVMENCDIVDDENEIANPFGICISLLHGNKLKKELHIQYPIEGKYIFDKNDEEISEFLYFEAVDGNLTANCVRPAYFKMNNGEIKYSVEISNRILYRIEKFSEKYFLYIENENKESNIFHNYIVDSGVDIIVGRSKTCDIIYSNRNITRSKISIKWEKKGWNVESSFLEDGVIVNDTTSSIGEYKVGSLIWLAGLKIILGIGFISINDGNDRIRINSIKLRRYNDSFFKPEIPISDISETRLFNRFPRRREALNAEPVIIEAPPISLSSNNIPLLLRMGSPLVMSSASLMAGNITAMLSSVLFPVLTQKYSDKQRKEYEERRTKKYNEYLEQKKEELKKEIIHEETILNNNYPEFAKILEYVDSEIHLWERRKTDDDFLMLRLGHGQLPMIAKCDYPKKSFDIDDDPLVKKMYEFVEVPSYIHNVPIMSSFIEDNICGVLGSRKLELGFVKQLIMQLALLHSYDEIKLIVLIDAAELEFFSFVKYIPHVWSDQKDFRFLATTSKDASQISEFLQKEVAEFIEKPTEIKEILKNRPYYFVFALDKRIFESMEILKNIMQAEKNCGVSILTVFDDLPKECVKIFDLKESGKHSVIYLKQIEKADDAFFLDEFDDKKAENAMIKLSNINLKILSQSYALPKMISFLEMFDVGKIEHLNPLNRWRENNPVKSLATPVGVDITGEIFTLDLHEKYQGPHGLVAGMTGSGKSEFIITYILSMAVNYHPDEVAFILIDYKGGGLAGAFEDKDRGVHLPHLVGTITNLDGASIQRSLMSIQSELKRRQSIFNKAKSFSNEGTMDIYTYQKLYRNGQVEEPMPHLFIISDEFAELKSQEPDFMDQLISAARIGRSLGIHLILATQKPAGVVNDQIWSNTKFRVCLKVQDRGDSIEMLKRPEAAELKNIGRFYLQVGYNEFFALGQSAWCGAPYIPQDTVVVQQDEEILFLDSLGQAVLKTKPVSVTKDSGIKQIVAVVKYLSELAVREGIKPKSLWQEPLEKNIGVEDIINKYKIGKRTKIEIPLGMVDDPYRQQQYPFFMSIQKENNYLIVGTSGSGKTTFIQTMLYMLARDYSSEQVNFYILDFSSRTLNAFRNLPHCGAVLMDENEGEIEQVVSLLEAMVEERKVLFAETEVSNYDSYIKANMIPLIVLVIDNLSGIEEFKKGREILERITNLMKNGASYGIKVVASISNLNDCLYRMQHEFSMMIALQANDRYAYSNILNVHCNYHPPQIAGRGMCAMDGEGLELQVALVQGSADEQLRSSVLKQKLKQFINENQGKQKAVKIDTARTDEGFEEFCDTFSKHRIPLGYNLENGKKVAVPLQQLKSISLYFGNMDGVVLPLKNLLYSAKWNSMDIRVVRRCKNSVFDTVDNFEQIDSENRIVYYNSSVRDLAKLNDDLISVTAERTGIRKKACEDLNIGNELEDWRNPNAIKKWRKIVRSETTAIFVLFESMVDFQLALTPELVGKFQTIFKMCEGYNIYFGACFYAEDQVRLNKTKNVEKNSGYKIGVEYDIEDKHIEETLEETRAREVRHAVLTINECFNEEKFSLLFGGRYDCQNLVNLPYEYGNITSACKSTNFNRFLMFYRGKTVKMQMPMRKMKQNAEDLDELSIIE